MDYTREQLDKMSQPEVLAVLRRDLDIYSIYDESDSKDKIVDLILAQQAYVKTKPRLVPYLDQQRLFHYHGEKGEVTYPTNFVEK